MVRDYRHISLLNCPQSKYGVLILNGNSIYLFFINSTLYTFFSKNYNKDVMNIIVMNENINRLKVVL